MPFSNPWTKGDEKELVRYSRSTFPQGWIPPANLMSYLSTRKGRRELAEAIYIELQSRKIEYTPALYHWEADKQLIRTPSEILGPPHHGTCLDLSLLFSGLCLAHQLRPLIIVLDGHAFAAVCLAQNAADQILYGRAGEDAFQRGLSLPRDREALERLFEENKGDFLPVECTGFAHWASAQANLPESQGRSGGLLEFEAAVKVARRHLSGSRSLLFAVDVDWVQRDLGFGIAESDGSLTFYPRLTTRVPEEQLRQLLDIIERLRLTDANDGFFRIYRATLAATTRPLDSNKPSVLVADLCELSPINGKAWPPLIEFIERLALAEGIEAPLALELQRWVDASAALVSPATAAGEIKRIRQELQAEKLRLAGPDTLSLLQVYLEPDCLNRTEQRRQPLFMVELVLWSPLTGDALVLESDQVNPSMGGAKRLWTLDDLPSLLDRVLARRETVSLIPEIRRLVIEVVAPSKVLLYGFEGWRHKNSKTTYGIDFPLVVRLQDRLVIPDLEDQKRADEFWRRKWNIFRNRVCRRRCEELMWQKEEDLDVLGLQDEDDLACLGLSSPLLPEKREFFDVLRDAGIPIAIWLRGSDLGPAAPTDWPQRVLKLIQGEPLSDLRHAVQRVRREKEVRTDEKHFGNSLTLLWDEPDRQPPKYGERGVFV